MISAIRLKNIFAFSNEVCLSFEANMQTKRFPDNVFSEGKFNIVKSTSIYGPNNVGKTCLIRCFTAIKNIMLNKEFSIMPNIFDENDTVSKIGLSFIVDGKKYNFDVLVETKNNTIVYEKFSETTIDSYNNRHEKVLILRDIKNDKYKCKNPKLEEIMKMTANNNILVYLLADEKFSEIKEMKKIITSFAEKIDVIDMNDVPIEKTIRILKNHETIQEKVVNFIKNADLYMDDFKYEPNIQYVVSDEANELVQSIDMLKLFSVYKGKIVPSYLFDSLGTKKIVALASYIIEALENGRILIIDELDSSIHFILTRALVSMFNNERNKNAQMIFTVHDTNLMDLNRLFRKEQIAFMTKDDEQVYLYTLDAFSAGKDKIRETTDIIEKYKKGVLGAVPNPDMFDSLLDATDGN